MTKKLAAMLARQQIAAMRNKPEQKPRGLKSVSGNGSPHGFFRLHIGKRDFRGDRSCTIYYGKKSELFYCEDESEALRMWRRLCKLENLIIKTIGGELLNQW